ncbi:MAG: DUF302 domain-containing protein [Candidatus Acidiferrum sp.]
MNPTSNNDNGLVHLSSPYSVAETSTRLQSMLQTKGIQIFCRIDHSGEAEKVGFRMRPTQLLIFGNPRGGTPLMLAAPTVAIDLPLKALVWEDAAGKVWITYNSPAYFEKRHDIPPELIKNIAGTADLLNSLVAA